MPSTSVLLGLEDEFVVFRVERLSRDDLRVVIEHRDRKAACPACVVDRQGEGPAGGAGSRTLTPAAGRCPGTADRPSPGEPPRVWWGVPTS